MRVAMAVIEKGYCDHEKELDSRQDLILSYSVLFIPV